MFFFILKDVCMNIWIKVFIGVFMGLVLIVEILGLYVLYIILIDKIIGFEIDMLEKYY